MARRVEDTFGGYSNDSGVRLWEARRAHVAAGGTGHDERRKEVFGLTGLVADAGARRAFGLHCQVGVEERPRALGSLPTTRTRGKADHAPPRGA